MTTQSPRPVSNTTKPESNLAEETAAILIRTPYLQDLSDDESTDGYGYGRQHYFYVPSPRKDRAVILREFYAEYDPMIGIRIGGTLAVLIILFGCLLYIKSKCKQYKMRQQIRLYLTAMEYETCRSPTGINLVGFFNENEHRSQSYSNPTPTPIHKSGLLKVYSPGGVTYNTARSSISSTSAYYSTRGDYVLEAGALANKITTPNFLRVFDELQYAMNSSNIDINVIQPTPNLTPHGSDGKINESGTQQGRNISFITVPQPNQGSMSLKSKRYSEEELESRGDS